MTLLNYRKVGTRVSRGQEHLARPLRGGKKNLRCKRGESVLLMRACSSEKKSAARRRVRGAAIDRVGAPL
jgi:hypothetical protein